MKSRPDGLDEHDVVAALTDGWGFAVEGLEYAPLGFGSFHWVATDASGNRRFVTVDDLDHKPEDTRERALIRLRSAFDTARALRADGLGFVIAPLPTRAGESVVRLGDRHAIALYRYVEGRAGAWGEPLAPPDRDVIAVLIELHQHTAAHAVAPPWDLDPPGRHHLETALRDAGDQWRGGPFSEAARGWVNDHADDLVKLLGRFDRLAAETADGGPDVVITHGEPHAGNTIRTTEGLALIDWDTVALAPPERDLWLVADVGGDLTAYAEATGHEPDPTALELYRLGWELSDIAAYTNFFRSAHEGNEDAEQSWLLLDRMVLQ